MSCCNCKLSVVSLIISSLALALQILQTSLNDIEELRDNLVYKFVQCFVIASIAFVNALSIGLKNKVDSAANKVTEANNINDVETQQYSHISTTLPETIETQIKPITTIQTDT